MSSGMQLNQGLHPHQTRIDHTTCTNLAQEFPDDDSTPAGVCRDPRFVTPRLAANIRDDLTSADVAGVVPV